MGAQKVKKRKTGPCHIFAIESRPLQEDNPRTAPPPAEQGIETIREILPPTKLYVGEDWEGDTYNNHTLAALPAKEVQALIASLQALKTSTDQSHKVTQTTH